MLEQAFEVATEFKFDIGQALINTNALKGAVDGLSQASNGALNSLSYLASGLVAHLGFGSGGLLTVLQQAVGFSQQLNQNTLNFSNVIGQNMNVLTGTIGTFNDRIMTSKAILDSISDTAIQFGIPTQDLAHLTEMISNPLAKAGKLGTNFSGGIQMARNLLLAAPSANLNPQAAAESLYRSLQDRMPIHGQLFSRLAGTNDFKAAHVTTQHQLMGMDTRKKIDLLNKALETLGLNSEAVQYRMNLLSTQFTIIKNEIARSLAPIGDAISAAIVKPLKQINMFLRANGPLIGEAIGKMFNKIFKNPENLIVGLGQLKNLGHDFRKALHLTELIQLFSFIGFMLTAIGIRFNGGVIRAIFMSIWQGLTFLVGLVPWTRVLVLAFNLLRVAVGSIMPMFLGFLAIFQALSRARVKAHLADMKAMTELTPRIADVTLKYKMILDRLLSPWNKLVDNLSKGFEWIFRWSFWTNILVGALEKLSTPLEKVSMLVLYGEAAFKGLHYVIFGFFDDIIHFRNPLANIGSNFRMGLKSFFDNNVDLFDPDKKTNVANVVNNNYVTANFDLKQQLEPDRIAFAVTDHLKKLTMYPQQRRGQSFSGPFSSNISVAKGS